MKIIKLLILTLIVSCSFESKDNKSSTMDTKPSSQEPRSSSDSSDSIPDSSVPENSIPELDPNAELKLIDSDGDLMSDFEEIQNGFDRYIADIPKVKVNFLQDYSITMNYEGGAKFKLSTSIARENPDFRYRVGNLFLKENSFNNAAKFARFSDASWGEIKQEDFSWVMYPEIDKEYYFNKIKEYNQHSHLGIKNSSITLENTLKLEDSLRFRSIEGLELNFYYYSYSKEAYVLLHTELIEQTFQSGIREEFKITIHNPPKELIDDNYFKHGEFIISEVKDFYIPELNIKYSDLMESVKAKSIPVYKTSPYENDLNYVAINSKGESFVSILQKVFSDKFKIEENKLAQIEQFTTNLPNYHSLHEIASETKLGKWFVMTNKIKDHYLKHSFTSSDSITLSYLTGSELARRSKEKIFASHKSVASKKSSTIIPLGNITTNSELEAIVYFKSLEGLALNVENATFNFAPSCRGRRNCSGRPWSVSSTFQVNSFTHFVKPWHVNDLTSALSSINLLINNTVLDVNNLVERNLLELKLKNNYLHFKLKDISDLNVIRQGSENLAFLKVSALLVDSAAEGLQVLNVTGRNINVSQAASAVCFQEAYKRKVPLAVTSFKFDEWQHFIQWGKRDPATGYVITKGHLKQYWTGGVVDVISTITNRYN